MVMVRMTLPVLRAVIWLARVCAQPPWIIVACITICTGPYGSAIAQICIRVQLHIAARFDTRSSVLAGRRRAFVNVVAAVFAPKAGRALAVDVTKLIELTITTVFAHRAPIASSVQARAHGTRPSTVRAFLAVVLNLIIAARAGTTRSWARHCRCLPRIAVCVGCTEFVLRLCGSGPVSRWDPASAVDDTLVAGRAGVEFIVVFAFRGIGS